VVPATDGHAKNFSIFLLPGGAYRMTPLYDVISIWPVIGHGQSRLPLRQAKLAMAVRSRNTHRELARIETRHWHRLAVQSGVPGAWEEMQRLMAGVEDAIATAEAGLPAGFPEGVATAIFEGMRHQRRRWEAGLPSARHPHSW
jgi:serine/threonine-protein kinase HipA